MRLGWALLAAVFKDGVGEPPGAQDDELLRNARAVVNYRKGVVLDIPTIQAADARPVLPGTTAGRGRSACADSTIGHANDVGCVSERVAQESSGALTDNPTPGCRSKLARQQLPSGPSGQGCNRWRPGHLGRGPAPPGSARRAASRCAILVRRTRSGDALSGVQL